MTDFLLLYWGCFFVETSPNTSKIVCFQRNFILCYFKEYHKTMLRKIALSGSTRVEKSKNLFGKFSFQQLSFLFQHELVIEIKILFIPVHPVCVERRAAVSFPGIRRSFFWRDLTSLWWTNEWMTTNFLTFGTVRTMSSLNAVAAKASRGHQAASIYKNPCDQNQCDPVACYNLQFCTWMSFYY